VSEEKEKRIRREGRDRRRGEKLSNKSIVAIEPTNSSLDIS